MLRKSRPISVFEKGFIETRECVQFAIEVSDSSVIPKIISNLKKYILPLKIKIEGENLVYHEDMDIPIVPIPNHIKDCETAADFVNSIKIKFEGGPLAFIAANDTKIAVNASHLLVDGGFWVDLVPRLLNDSIPDPTSGLVPTNTYELLKDDLKKKENHDTKTYKYEFSHIAGFKRHNDPDPSEKFDQVFCKYSSFENSADDFEFMKYKKRNNNKNKYEKFGLSESYWTMIPLVCMAIDNNLDISKFCISTCVDLRNDMKAKGQKIDQTIGMHYMDLNLYADPLKWAIKPTETTVLDIGKRMREDLNSKMTNGGIYRAYNAMCEGATAHSEKVYIGEVSNIGRFDLKKPFVDCWIQQTIRSRIAENYACVGAFSRNKHGQNTLVTRFQQPVTVMSDELANKYAKSLLFAMKEIPIETSIQEAFDEIRNFQKKL